MSDINRVFLTGRIVGNVELQNTSSGFAFCQFTLSQSLPKWCDGECVGDEPVEVDRIHIWGETAEELAPRLTDGAVVVIEGRIKINAREKDGKTWKNLQISATAIEVVGTSGATGSKDDGLPF
ncbi:MAG: single-stranded DNA-binding protein [Deltaproteobacteria bacterium]|nr:single-stranded DNA-binding protein [Deltaproteobacteria bacterium]